jgi:hypothetical protein
MCIYDVVRASCTMQYTTSCCTSYVRCRTCDKQDIEVRHCTCHIVRYVLCRTSTYEIVCHTYDIVCCLLHISYTVLYLGNGHTMSYVHDILYRRFISYTTLYARTMSHLNIRYRTMSDLRCRTSFRGGRFRFFKGTICLNVTCVQCENGKSISPIDSAQPTMAHDADTDSDLARPPDGKHPSARHATSAMLLRIA